MYNRYQTEGLVVLGVHAWSGHETKSDVEKFIQERSVNYPILLGGKNVHHDLYKCEYVPRVFFIDRHGRIAATKVGFDESEVRFFEKTIKELL